MLQRTSKVKKKLSNNWKARIEIRIHQIQTLRHVTRINLFSTVFSFSIEICIISQHVSFCQQVCKTTDNLHVSESCIYIQNNFFWFVFLLVILTWKHFNKGFLQNHTNGAWNIVIMNSFHVTFISTSLIFRTMNVIFCSIMPINVYPPFRIPR